MMPQAPDAGSTVSWALGLRARHFVTRRHLPFAYQSAFWSVWQPCGCLSHHGDRPPYPEPGEQLLAVTASDRRAPLEVPTGEQVAADQVLDYTGPELFIARAKELGAEFALNAENLPAVAAICRHLDGIPLAIEFAAARAATLGVEDVALSLRDRFALLTSGRRTSLPRHRTLRATLDWSYNLLTDPERLLLRRLAVFAGSFSLEAVCAVTNRGGTSEAEVANRVSNLVAKSLVTSDFTAGGGYFRLLETTRAYALLKLIESGELQELSRRYAEYYRRLLEKIEHGYEQKSKPGVYVDNVRAALEWCFGINGDIAIGVGLAASGADVLSDVAAPRMLSLVGAGGARFG
jgi:predicted ATPase